MYRSDEDDEDCKYGECDEGDEDGEDDIWEIPLQRMQYHNFKKKVGKCSYSRKQQRLKQNVSLERATAGGRTPKWK